MTPNPLEGGAPDTGERPSATADRYLIGDLAQEFAITTRTIRFYEARGLIKPARTGTMRTYSRRDRARLALILRGKNLGFSLEDIGKYLELYDSDPTQMAQTTLLLDKVEHHIADLTAKRADIDRALGELTEIRSKCQSSLEKARRGGA